MRRRVSFTAKIITLLFLSIPTGGQVQAQLNSLTVREAMSLVDRIPAVAAANKQRKCPEYSVTYWQPDEFAIQVRASCGPTRGMLIGNYAVNRRTGKVTKFGDNPESIADAQGKVLATQLVREAQKRILSIPEAQCLALEAAKALPGWDVSGAAVSVKQFSKLDTLENTMHFTATRVSSTPPVESGRMLTVFLDEARVRDDETGADVMSAGVGLLGSKLLALRDPAWLNDQEAASIALAVPQIAGNLRDGCKLYAGGASYSHGALMGVACKDATIVNSNVLVNLQTGAVTDPASGKSLDSAESRKVAERLLNEKMARRSELQKDVEAACALN